MIKVAELKEDRATSMEVWFRRFHGADMMKTYEVAIEELWHLISAADRYEFKDIGSQPVVLDVV